MKIGIYGGTFNPPHLGHMAAAQAAMAVLGLDKLFFIPAALPPHKELPADGAGAEHRLAMTALMADGLGESIGRRGDVEALDIELRRTGTRAPGNGPGARLRIGDEGFHGRREVGQGIAGPEDDAPMGDAGQSAMAPEKPPPCHPFDRLVVEGVDDGGRCGIGREKPFDKGPLAAFLGGEGPPERIIAHAGQFPERRIVGKAERHVMAAFAQPPGLIDGLPGASAAVVGPCDDDDAHT